MTEKYCELCGNPALPDEILCERCKLKASEHITNTPSNPMYASALTTIGCFLPFIFSGAAIVYMNVVLDGRGGSGLLLVFPFLAGVVIGVPMFISGIAISRREAKARNDETPPPGV